MPLLTQIKFCANYDECAHLAGRKLMFWFHHDVRGAHRPLLSDRREENQDHSNAIFSEGWATLYWVSFKSRYRNYFAVVQISVRLFNVLEINHVCQYLSQSDSIMFFVSVQVNLFSVCAKFDITLCLWTLHNGHSPKINLSTSSHISLLFCHGLPFAVDDYIFSLWPNTSWGAYTECWGVILPKLGTVSCPLYTVHWCYFLVCMTFIFVKHVWGLYRLRLCFPDIDISCQSHWH